MPRKSGFTFQQIANLVGVHRSTVGRILLQKRGEESYDPHLRARVHEVATRMGWVKDPLVKTKSERTLAPSQVGMMFDVRGLGSHSPFADIITCASASFSAHDYDISVFSGYDADEWKRRGRGTYIRGLLLDTGLAFDSDQLERVVQCPVCISTGAPSVNRTWLRPTMAKSAEWRSVT